MKIDIKVQGLDELVDRFNTDKKNQLLKTIVKHYAARVQKGAIKRVPVATGFLKRSIMPPQFSSDGMYAIIRATAEYAPYLEYATRLMTAQPYMTPAFQEIQRQFLDDIKKAVNK